MSTELRTEFSAPWKQRFRLPETFGMQVASTNLTRGLVVTNTTGQYQLYAWHTPTGQLRPLTHKADGVWSGVAIADCTLAYEDEADTLKAYDVTLFKGTPQEKPALYRSASPITYAEQVKAPILIIQGLNDTRCPPRQIEVYETKMKALGKDITVHWYDAGHISTDIEQQIADQERMMHFAYRILKDLQT